MVEYGRSLFLVINFNSIQYNINHYTRVYNLGRQLLGSVLITSHFTSCNSYHNIIYSDIVWQICSFLYIFSVLNYHYCFTSFIRLATQSLCYTVEPHEFGLQ